VQVAGSRFDCNFIDMDSEVYYGRTPRFDDLGGNTCTCEANSHLCQVLSTNLTAPDPIPD
jgi:hypothetical protein